LLQFFFDSFEKKKAFSNDNEYPDYDADDDDMEWLERERGNLPAEFSDDLALFFETVMDCLEKATGFSPNVNKTNSSNFS
jgi:hypothetical protein